MVSKQHGSNWTKAEPEAEPPTSRSLGEPEAEATKAPTLQSFGEPLPEWHSAIETWGVAWELYQYGIGTAFGILMLLTAAFIIKTVTSNRARRPKKASLIVLILLFMFGLSRCMYLCIDAYNTKRILPQAVANLLWSLGNPCIVTAYTLIFLVLKNIFVLRARFMGWYTAKNIAIIAVPYFSLQLAAEITLLYIPSFNVVTFTCQIVYVILSLMLSVFYSFIAHLLWKNFSGANIHGRKESRQKLAWTVTKNSPRGRRTLSILKTCIAAVFGGVALCAIQIYSMSGVYGVFSHASYVEAWPWLSLNYAMRILELFLSLVLFAASTRGTQNQQSHSFSVSLEGSLNSRVGQRSRLILLTPNVIGDAGLNQKGTSTL